MYTIIIYFSRYLNKTLFEISLKNNNIIPNLSFISRFGNYQIFPHYFITFVYQLTGQF